MTDDALAIELQRLGVGECVAVEAVSIWGAHEVRDAIRHARRLVDISAGDYLESRLAADESPLDITRVRDEPDIGFDDGPREHRQAA